jgi:hypothetical protein
MFPQKDSINSVSDYATLLTKSGSYIGEEKIIPTLGPNGTKFWWNGSVYVPDGGEITLLQDGLGIPYIAPAATFTNITVSDNAGKVKLTGAGVHGLTSSPANGKSIYIASGTNWTAGFYEIQSINDTSALTLTTTYSSSFGVPTVKVVNQEVTVKSVNIPGNLIRNNGQVLTEGLITMTASTNIKTIKLKFGSTEFFSVGLASLYPAFEFRRVFMNRNIHNYQVTFSPSISRSFEESTVSNISFTKNTTLDNTLSLTFTPSAVNEVTKIEYLTVRVRPA